MDLNNTFNNNRFEEYALHLKNSGLSHTSLKRKLSSLASFQRFLLKKKFIQFATINSAGQANDNKSSFKGIKSFFPFKKKTR